MYSASDLRQKMPSGISPCSSVDVAPHGVGPGDQGHQVGAHPGSGREGAPRRPHRSAETVALLEITSQCAGAVTVMSKAALRSGWSKQANIRLASAVSNCEYR